MERVGFVDEVELEGTERGLPFIEATMEDSWTCVPEPGTKEEAGPRRVPGRTKDGRAMVRDGEGLARWETREERPALRNGVFREGVRDEWRYVGISLCCMEFWPSHFIARVENSYVCSRDGVNFFGARLLNRCVRTGLLGGFNLVVQFSFCFLYHV